MNVKESAIEIIKTLNKAGYTAYFAGGWVRDYVLDHPSDDIDIATNATPETIRELFSHTIPVGIAFGVVIVVMHGHHFEVATFRKDLEYSKGRRPDRIELSTAIDDAYRRDFTINGMFYDPLTGTVHDHVEGEVDLRKGIIRTIGDPHERFSEDRLRMIRAIRFASRFGFSIDEETRNAIKAHAHTLFPAVAMERIWQEFNKMAKSPRFAEAVVELHQLGLLPIIFPALKNMDLQIIQERVTHFNQFPPGSPAILYLMELFPNAPLEERLELCQYLRTSLYEGQLVEFAYKGKQLLTREEISPHAIEDSDWAKFYADRFYRTCFDVLAARLSEAERIELLQRHHKRHERLLPHIKRIVDKKPLVTAAVLQDYGILPGKQMGALLKEAERLAIMYDIHDPAIVVELLQQTSLWPKS